MSGLKGRGTHGKCGRGLRSIQDILSWDVKINVMGIPNRSYEVGTDPYGRQRNRMGGR